MNATVNATENRNVHEHGHQHHDPHPGPTVTVTINGVERSIHRGHQTVAAIKTVGGVPLADDLDQLIDGKLTPLPDDGAVTIKGCEVFVSHVKDGGSS
jgi:hypothetical protein